MVNEVRLIGALGADPEIRHLDGDKNVATLSVATNESYKDGDDWKQIVEWHRVVVWNRAKSIEKMKKGDFVYVQGKNKTRSWEDKDGVKRYTTEVVGLVRSMPKTGVSQNENAGNADGGLPEMPTGEDPDLPF